MIHPDSVKTWEAETKYFHEVIRGLHAENERLRAARKHEMDLDKAERELKAVIRRDQWDKWYAGLPADLREKLSLHDFKRLGECFKAAFRVDG